MDECLLVLVSTPNIEGSLVDWLLKREDVSAFTSFPVAGHGVEHHHMTMAEQVEGRQKQTMFRIHIPLSHARQVVADLSKEFPGSGLSYWITPIVDSGFLE